MAACPQPTEACTTLPLVILDARLGGVHDATNAVGESLADYNLAVAQEVARILQTAGVAVRFLRAGDCEFADDPEADKTARINLAQQCWQGLTSSFSEDEVRQKCVLVSVGHMLSSNPETRGTTTRFARGSIRGEQLARAIQAELVSALGTTDLGAVATPDPQDRLLVETSMPAVWVAPVQASNSEDTEIMGRSDYVQKAAQAIAKGILTYLGIQIPKPNSEPTGRLKWLIAAGLVGGLALILLLRRGR